MTDIDISPEELTRLKTLAQKATPEFVREGHFIYGPKHPASKHPNGRILIANIIEGANQRDPNLDGGVGIGSGKDDAAYIAAAHPGVILAICEGIEQLRERVATLESLSGEDDACMTQLEVERDALEEQVARLEKEGDWLAARCREFCDSNNYCNECALYPGDADFPHPDCGQKIDVENARWRFEKHVVSDWREAARKAVEEA